eukprot:scaffold2058_cov115-Cylindrotheca_fusiformis.AAC.9
MKSPESPTSPLSYQDSNNNNNSHRTNGNGQKSAPTTSSSINRHSSKAMNISQYFQSMCYANAVKESKNEKIGLVVKRSPVWNSIYISAIKESSKFADSKLEVGMVILAINGIKCPNTVKAIQKVMKDCEGDLTIVAASISPEIDVTATTTTSTTTTTGTSPATSPTNVETKQEEDPTPKPVVLTPDVPDVQDDVFEDDDDGPELIDDEEHPHNVSKSSSIGFDDLSVGPETIDDDIHPDKAVNSVSQGSAFANVVPQDSGADDALEMVLTEEKDEAAGVGAAATFQDSFSSSELPSAHSSTSDFSNTPTPRRRVMKSMRDDSPVRVSSIDHTGGIIVTPKTSPSNDTQQQAHEQQHYEDDAPEEKKEAPEDLEKDRTRFDHSPKRMEADLYERKQAPEEVLHVGRSDRKMAPHEVEADRNYDDVERNNQAAEELEVAPMATRRAAQRRNSEDRDYAIKREARRSTHMAVMGQSTQPPPPTRPGAYAVSSRPSVSKGGGGARSSSPVPQAAYTSNDDDVKRRALPPTGPARLPGAQRVAGPSARLGATPEVQNLQPSSVPRRGSHLSEEMSLGSTGSTRHSGGASIGSAQQRSVGGGGVPNSPGAVSAGSAPPPSKTQRSPELTRSPSTAVARNTGVPLSQHAAGITDQVPTPGLADSDDEGSDDGMPGAQRVAGMHGRTSERFETADTFPTGGSASVDDGAFSQNSRYAPTTASAPHTTTGAAPAFSGVGVGVPLHSGATSVVSSVSSCTFDDHHTTLSGDYTRRGSAEISRRGSAEISRRGSAEFARRGSADQNSLPAVKSEDYEDNEEEEALVIAAVVQDDPDVIAERIRQQIMLETARADVVVMERDDDEDEDSDFESTRRQEELKKHKPKNVREKLFGDKKSRDVSMDLDYAPDQYIRKRDLLPCSVKRNETTDMWVASVVTNQKAWEDNDKKELERTRVTFSGKTRTEATEAGLAMGTPILQAFSDNPICFMCKAKFAVFNRPNNCKNCGVVICNKCTCLWSSKRFPETYPISKSSHSACLACDWSANKFQEALLKGDHAKAVKLYESGNVNLRCPFVPKKQKSEEVMYPIHMAIIGGNIHSVRWLVSEHFCPLQVDVRTKGKMKAVALETSKGRSPVRLAITQKNEDILKFLISEQGLSLFQEDLKNEFKWVLAHLTNTLYRVPYESPPVAAAPSPQKVTELDLEAKVELACNASATVCSPASAASAASAESTLADF